MAKTKTKELQKAPPSHHSHLVPRRHVVEQRVHPRYVAVEPPVAEPVVRREETDRVLLGYARPAPRPQPEVERRDSRRDGTRGADEAERQGSVPNEEAEGESRPGNRHVGEVVDHVLAVARLAVVRLVVEVERRRHREEVDACVLVEEGSSRERRDRPRRRADGGGWCGRAPLGWAEVRRHRVGVRLVPPGAEEVVEEPPVERQRRRRELEREGDRLAHGWLRRVRREGE